MNRQEALEQATEAAGRAAYLAREAERAAHNSGAVGRFAEAGAVWADTARAYTALAAVLPDTTTDQQTTEV